MNEPAIEVPDHKRQTRFHELLVVARTTWLVDALREAVGKIDPRELKRQLDVYVPSEAQKILGIAGIRDEDIFPTPILLEAQPYLVGYYRLLIGIPQKSFYTAASGRSMFRSMETTGTSNAKQLAALPDLCTAMGQGLAELVKSLTPAITPRDVIELPILTLGSQFQGADNNIIGQAAIRAVYNLDFGRSG